jgi:hypothetical protein
MNQPVWAEIQRRGVIGSYVLPLIVGVISRRRGDEHQLHAELVLATGVLVAGGRGLGITARHVVKQLLAQAPIPDLWARVGDDEVRAPLAGFTCRIHQ